MKSPWLKKIFLCFAGFFLLLIVAAVAIPVFVKVDKFRPEIVEAANRRMNAELVLGELSLSLWGQIKVQIAGLELKDLKGRQMVSAKDVYFQLPFSSIFSGQPSVILKLAAPKIFVRKENGKINLLTLVKPSENAGAAGASPDEKNQGGEELPEIVQRARLGISITQALMEYTDASTSTRSTIQDFNLQGEDLSLSRPTRLNASASMDTVVGKTMSVKGPVKVSVKMTPTLAGGKFEHANGNLNLDLNDLEITVPGSFQKKAGIPLDANCNLAVTAERADITQGKFRLGAMNILFTGGGAWSPQLIWTAEIKAEPFKLSALAPLLPAVEANQAFLKADPEFSASLKAAPNRVEPILVTMKAPGTELSAKGQVSDFEKPGFSFEVTGANADWDQLYDFEKQASAAKAAAGSHSEKTAAAEKAKVADYDSMVQAMSESPLFQAAHGRLTLGIKEMKAYGVKMQAVKGEANLSNLITKVESFSLELLDGKIDSNATVNLRGRRPTYFAKGSLKNLDLQKAVGSQMPLFKNTVVGIASFQGEVSGESFNPDLAKRNLKGAGSFSVLKAKFASIDISKMLSESLNKSIGQIAEKVPALKGKSIQVPANIESRYSEMKSRFSIQNGLFTAPDFVATAEKEKGVDLKGFTQVGMVDYSLKADWEVIDTYNLTKARDLSVEQGGLKVEHILAEGSGPFRFPIKVGGTLFAPKYDYTAIPGSLGQVALTNIGKAAGEKVKAEAKNKAMEQIQKIQAPPAIKDALKGIFGK